MKMSTTYKRKFLLALGIFAIALAVLLIISSKCSARDEQEQQELEAGSENLAQLNTNNNIINPAGDKPELKDNDKVSISIGDASISPKFNLDIAITEVTISSTRAAEKEPVRIIVKIANLGGKPAQDITTSFYADNKLIDTKYIKFLSSSEDNDNSMSGSGSNRDNNNYDALSASYNLNLNSLSEAELKFCWAPDTPGVAHTLIFYAYMPNSNEELSQSNNYYKLTVNVASSNYNQYDGALFASSSSSAAAVIITMAALCGLSVLTMLAFIDRYKFYSVFFFPLYVKLKRERILDNFTRGRIYGYLEAHPGAHYNELKNTLGLNNSVLAYHLNTLEREEYIKSKKEGNLRCFYPAYSSVRCKNGFSNIQNKILEFLYMHPGITQKELVEQLGCASQQVVSYNVKVLSKARVLRTERNGKEIYIFTTTHAAN